MSTARTTPSNTPTGRHDMNSQNTPETATMVHITETTGGPSAAEMLAGLPESTTITMFDGAPVGSGRSQRLVTDVDLPHEEIARLLTEAGQAEGWDDEGDEFTRGEALLIEARYAWAREALPSGYVVDGEDDEDPTQMIIRWAESGPVDDMAEVQSLPISLRGGAGWVNRGAFEAAFEAERDSLLRYIQDGLAVQAEQDVEAAEELRGRQDEQREQSEIQVVDLEHDPADGRWSWTLRSSDPEIDDEHYHTTTYPYEGDGIYQDHRPQVTGNTQFTLRDCVDRPEVAQLRCERFHGVVDAE